MKRPLLLGHRGARASKNIPENTLASFELCLEHGCDGFEFDVRLAADGQAVICHDSTCHDSTCNDAAGGRLKIDKSTSDALGLPRLDQVFRQFAHRAFLDIELKVAGLERLLLATLREHPPQKGYVVSSFLPAVLHAIHVLDRSIVIGQLCENRRQLSGWQESAAQWIIPRHDLASGELIEQVRQAGRKTMVWTVNNAARMREFAKWGADAIISDDTQLLVRTLGGEGGQKGAAPQDV
jgi:glycerophosphoryl diester phosphodiesterase